MLAAVFTTAAVAVFAVAVALGAVAVFSIAAVFAAAIVMVIVAEGRAGEYGNDAKSCCKKFLILHRFNNGL